MKGFESNILVGKLIILFVIETTVIGIKNYKIKSTSLLLPSLSFLFSIFFLSISLFSYLFFPSILVNGFFFKIRSMMQIGDGKTVERTRTTRNERVETDSTSN